MDSSKGIIISSVLGLLLIGILSVYINYSSDLGSKRALMEGYVTTLDNLKEELAAKTALLDKAKEQIIALQDLADGFGKNANKLIKLSNDKQVAVNHITEMEESRKNLLRNFLEMVQKVRTNSEGMEFPALTLNSGQTLQIVKLQKITDTTVSLSHSNGLMKIEGKELPEDLRERFRYGMEPMISDVPAAATTSAQPANPTPSNSTSASHIQIEIDAIDEKIVQLEKTKTEWANAANSYRNQISSAQYSGRPTYTARAQAAQADQNIQIINGQISKLQEEQLVLRKKLATTMAAP